MLNSGRICRRPVLAGERTVNLTQCLHRQARISHERIATVFGARRKTYAQLRDRVARLAAGLRALGVAPSDRVGILMLNSDRYLEAMYATYWAGGAVNPVNFRWSADEIAYSLDDCDTRVLVVDDAFLPMVPQFKQRSKSLRTLVHAGDGETPAGMVSLEALVARHEPADDAMRSGDDLAGVFYTGGTTGFPKGVMNSHAGLYSNALAALADDVAAEGGVALHAAPMFHMADGVFFNASLMTGSTNVIIPAFDPVKVLDAIEKERVTHALLVPTMIQLTVDHPEARPARHGEPRVRRLRRIADQRSGARSRHARIPDRGLHPGLRDDRAIADHHRAVGVLAFGRRPGQGEQAALGRPAERRGGPARRRRQRPPGAQRHGRRDRRPRAGRDAGVLEQARRIGRRAAQRVDAHRRRRLPGRRRLPVRRRPRQGHDRHRRRERVFGGGRERGGAASGRGRGRRHRHSVGEVGRGGARRGRAEGRDEADRRRDHRALQGADRRLQGSAQRRVRRGAADVRRRQGAEARDPQAYWEGQSRQVA